VVAYLNNARTGSAVQDPTPVNPAWGTRSSDRVGYDGAGRTIAKRYLPDAAAKVARPRPQGRRS